LTKTCFSNYAVSYGLHVGLRLLGWEFPRGESLMELTDNDELHPIANLTAQKILENNFA